MCYKNLPLQFFDDDFTQQFIQYIRSNNYELPRRSAVTKILNDELDLMEQNLVKFLSELDSNVSFTYDGWTGPNFESWYGLTIHFINKLWNLISFAIDLIPANGKHSGKDIAEFFYESLKKFDLIKKIQGITTDNARVNDTFVAEFCKISDDEGVSYNSDIHFRCLSHVLNLGVQSILRVHQSKI